MPSYVTPRVKSFIGTILAADATLQTLLTPVGKVHWDEAPQGSLVPYLLIYALSPAIPNKALGNQTVSENSVIGVVGVTRGNTNQGLLPIMDRVDELLESASGTTSGAQIFVISGEGEIDYSEPREPGASGPRYIRLGRRWRVQSKAG